MLRRNYITAKEIESELEEWQERVDIIRHKLKFIRQLPAVACIEQIDPLMTAEGRIPAMVEIAGGIALAAEDGVLPAPPDIILLMLPGKSIGETLGEVGVLMQQSWFTESPAFLSERVYIADRRDHFQLPGPGMIGSLEILAEVINSGDFHFGFEGEGWVRFSGKTRN